VLLLSIAEKARPVTIVDILRRQKAQQVLSVSSFGYRNTCHVMRWCHDDFRPELVCTWLHRT
jgi:hypothetical protein